MRRDRVVHIPVVVGGAGGGVGAMLGVVGAVIVIAVLIVVAVECTYPAPHFQPVTSCAPFCTPTTAAATTPSAEFPFGGER
jgi:uncharacterized membrane protein